MRRAREFGLRAENIRVVGPEIQARKTRLVGEFADYRRGAVGGRQVRLHPRAGAFRGASTAAPHRRRRGSRRDRAPPPRSRRRPSSIATGSRWPTCPCPAWRTSATSTSDDALELESFPVRPHPRRGGHRAGGGAPVRGSRLRGDRSPARRTHHARRRPGRGRRAGTALWPRRECASTAARICSAPTATRDGPKRVWFECGGSRTPSPRRKSSSPWAAALHRPPGSAPRRRGISQKGGVRGRRRPAFLASAHLRGGRRDRAVRDRPHRHPAGRTRRAQRCPPLGKLAGAPEEIDYRLKLFVLFTEPQMAQVGLTEKEAGPPGATSRGDLPFADHGKAMVRGETDGFVKLIADRATGEIVGGAAVGPEVGGTDPRDRRWPCTSARPPPTSPPFRTITRR